MAHFGPTSSIHVSPNNNPRNGFVSAIFGPLIWVSTHMIAQNYPLYPTSKDKKNFEDWFLGLGHILPCGACRDNFKSNLEAVGYDTKRDFINRHTLTRLVWKLHNEVNRMLKKDVFVTFADNISFYERLRATDCTPNDNKQEGSCSNNERMKPKCMVMVIPKDAAEGPNTNMYVSSQCMQPRVNF